jgi:hypothetical protein
MKIDPKTVGIMLVPAHRCNWQAIAPSCVANHCSLIPGIPSDHHGGIFSTTRQGLWEGIMLIRFMTVATILMLLACLVIGATIAFAPTAKAAEAQNLLVAADTALPSPDKAALPVQADPDVPTGPQPQNLADAGVVDRYDFDQLPTRSIPDADETVPYAVISNC